MPTMIGVIANCTYKKFDIVLNTRSEGADGSLCVLATVGLELVLFSLTLIGSEYLGRLRTII
jgi:hypothetical protein